jgi:hypothetical protein
MTNIEPTDLHLDVPYYYQNDPANGLTEYWQERSCGILALKMVIDYYRLQQGLEPVVVSELFDRAMELGGVDEAGNWRHAGLVKTTRTYGLESWRRVFSLSTDQRKAVLAEGASAVEVLANNLQQRREALPTLVDSIEHGHPVIISVAKNFDEIDKPHLVVVTGIRRRVELGAYMGLFYHDPYKEEVEDRKDRYISIEHFNSKWNYLGIFVQPKSQDLV